MKVDLSTIFLILILVSPGLFALKSKDLIVPRSFRSKGASEELAELVSLSLFIHALLTTVLANLLFILGLFAAHKANFYFKLIDTGTAQLWLHQHLSIAILLCIAYVLTSFLAGHLLGLVYGIVTLNGGITARLIDRAKWLQRFSVHGTLGEFPILYKLLTSQPDANGIPKTVFLELEMKSALGFYSGQVSRAAIVRDEEPHRLIYLIDAVYKSTRDSTYTRVDSDGILIDLADVTTVLIKQVTLTEIEQPAYDNASEEAAADIEGD